MNLTELLAPYSEPQPDGTPLRTVEGQVKWLLSKSIPRSHIDQAVLSVYDEIERGKTFASGADLDHYLLEVATHLHKVELTDSVVKLEAFFNQLMKTHRDAAASEIIAKMQRPLNWLQRFRRWLFRL